MSQEKFIVNMAEGQTRAELVIRQLTESNELKVKPPELICIAGVPGTIARFLEQRVSLLNQKECHILVNREKLRIGLHIDEKNPHGSDYVEDKLEYHHKLIEFGINTGKKWEPNDLGHFFKLNRVYFLDRAENMALVSALKGFEAKVAVSIEKVKNESGSFADNYSGAVTSNLPGAFKLNLPVFKGASPESLEVEFWAHVNGRDVSLELVSAGAVQIMEESRDRIFDAEISKIEEVAGDIAILEQ